MYIKIPIFRSGIPTKGFTYIVQSLSPSVSWSFICQGLKSLSVVSILCFSCRKQHECTALELSQLMKDDNKPLFFYCNFPYRIAIMIAVQQYKCFKRCPIST